MGTTMLQDLNQVTFRNTSGAYATGSGASGLWIGLVTNHTINEETNQYQTRFAGASSRGVSRFTLGPLDVTGTLEYIPQTWEFLGYALGSIAETSGASPQTHTIKEANSNHADPFTGQVLPDIEIEDFQNGGIAGSNFVRTVAGAVVNTLSIDLSEGDQAKVSVDYIGQNVSYSSGTSLKTGENTDEEFMTEHFAWEIPAGTSFPKVKSATIEINNTLDPHHYVNGSKVIGYPIPTNRDYTITVTAVADSTYVKNMYDAYFLGGSTFNMVCSGINEIGSPTRSLAMWMSGCILADMDAPTLGEGATEETFTIVPQHMGAVAIDKRTDYWLLGSHA